MSKKRRRIAFIVEGIKTEEQYLKSLKKYFFSDTEFDVICIPADGNIYMIWKKLKEDDFETDIIELIREQCEKSEKRLGGLSRDDFMEIYLLFDFDPHQNNLKLSDEENIQSVLLDMMGTFDNETEHGKLYISYPMVEALRDITEASCQPFYQCAIPLSDIPNYKQLTGEGKNTYTAVKKYNKDTWMMIISIFLIRCRCLFEMEQDIDKIYLWYKQTLFPQKIAERQLEFFNQYNLCFVMSAFPEFLIDYFKEDYWDTLQNTMGKIQQLSKTISECKLY